MQDVKNITIISNKNKISLNVGSILYVLKVGNCAEIHVSGDRVYTTRTTLAEFSEMLGDSFLMIHRGCLVSVMAIHDITDKINLSNGESLIYTKRKKNEILDEFHRKQKSIIESFHSEGIPLTLEAYHEHYKCFDAMPFAFTDIEMVFNEERHAVDWIFRYGNQALSELEKYPLEQLLGHSFGSIFANMDSKWLRSYERSALYGEILEIVDFSPEINAYLKVISFPTFPGHCGCILFDVSENVQSRDSKALEKAFFLNLGKAFGWDK